MILVKDRTGSKNGTADSTLVGVFDSKRPLYRLVKWLILHIFPLVFRLLYGFRVVGRMPEEKMENGCISVCTIRCSFYRWNLISTFRSQVRLCV